MIEILPNRWYITFGGFMAKTTDDIVIIYFKPFWKDTNPPQQIGWRYEKDMPQLGAFGDFKIDPYKQNLYRLETLVPENQHYEPTGEYRNPTRTDKAWFSRTKDKLVNDFVIYESSSSWRFGPRVILAPKKIGVECQPCCAPNVASLSHWDFI